MSSLLPTIYSDNDDDESTLRKSHRSLKSKSFHTSQQSTANKPKPKTKSNSVAHNEDDDDEEDIEMDQDFEFGGILVRSFVVLIVF